MVNLKYLRIGHWIIIILLLASFLPLWVNDILTSWLQSVIPYKPMLSILVLIIVIELTFILLYYNYSKSLEATTNNKPETTIQNQEQKPLSRSQAFRRLQTLSQAEKKYLAKFLDEDSRTLKFGFDDEIADGLRHIGILAMTSSVVTLYQVSYTMNPIFWECIKENPDVIDYKQQI